jgi:hypothetical protein
MFQMPAISGRAAGNVVAPSRVERTPVSFLFFHPENVEALHTSIRYQVYVRTGRVIDRQGDNQLRVVMTGVYQNSQSPTIESAIRGRSSVAVVQEMNSRVVRRAVDEIVSAMDMHRFYLNDIANPVPEPLDRAEFADRRRGTKTHELPVGF